MDPTDRQEDDREQQSAPSRREFLARVIAAGAAVPLLASCAGHSRVPPVVWSTEMDVSSLKKQGDSLVTDGAGADSARILIVRGAAEHFIAVSLHCTHQGCPVAPPDQSGVLICPCHGSRYNLEGKVIHGPAIYNLGRYATRYDNQTGRLAVSFRGHLPIQPLGY